MRVTIGTQAFVRIGGERKVLTHVAEGVVREVEVNVEFDQCEECGALLLPGSGSHDLWHRRQGPDGEDY